MPRPRWRSCFGRMTPDDAAPIEMLASPGTARRPGPARCRTSTPPPEGRVRRTVESERHPCVSPRQGACGGRWKTFSCTVMSATSAAGPTRRFDSSAMRKGMRAHARLADAGVLDVARGAAAQRAAVVGLQHLAHRTDGGRDEVAAAVGLTRRLDGPHRDSHRHEVLRLVGSRRGAPCLCRPAPPPSTATCLGCRWASRPSRPQHWAPQRRAATHGEARRGPPEGGIHVGARGLRHSGH